MNYDIVYELLYKTLIWIEIYHCDYDGAGYVNDSWQEISDTFPP